LTEQQASASFSLVSTDVNAESGAPPSGDVVAGASAAAAPARQAAVAARSPLVRIWNWFWRGNVRELDARLDASRAELLRRAKTAAEIARRTENSSEPFPASAEPVLCDLYRQSIHWSLSALHGDAAPVDASLMLRATRNDTEVAERVARAVVALSFVDFPRLPTSERAQLRIDLRMVAEALIAELSVPEQVVLALWAQRFLRLGLLAVFALLAVLLGFKLRDSAEEARDIAAGKPWKTSSTHSGCHSPAQECADTPDYFFHTQQESNPWVEIDLGSPQRFSAIRIENRKDCCSERASPLVFEASTDDQQWKPLARHEGTFATWRTAVPPTVARWVRVRIDSSQAMLHLARVRVLR